MAYEVDGWGVGELWIEEGCVVWHELPRPVPSPSAPPISVSCGEGLAAGPSLTPTHPRGGFRVDGREARKRADFASKVVRLVAAHLTGQLVDLGQVPVDLEYETAFHERCAQALRTVPRGEVVTYGELAALAGSPGAARAAGTFCARNRLGLFVPCHRVVAADGLGSYGSLGLAYKRRLLSLEGVTI
jgi:methylated-DNA-[protein]-cysteine S-methyltransferase